MRSIEIKSAEPTDTEAVSDLAHACGLSEWSTGDYMSELGRTDSLFFTASSDRSLLGFVIGRVVPGKAASVPDAEIYNIGVEPRVRMNGIGDSLLRRFIAECAERGVRRIWLEVRRSNDAAIRFYRKHAFSQQDIRKNFYRDPVEDAVVMMANITPC